MLLGKYLRTIGLCNKACLSYSHRINSALQLKYSKSDLKNLADNFRQSRQFTPSPGNRDPKISSQMGLQKPLYDYIMKNAQKNNPQSCINLIDKFCQQNWMMNLGPQKAKIVLHYLKQKKPIKILEIGSYCGYSSLILAHNSPPNSQLHCIEVNQQFVKIAKSIHQLAGVNNKISFHVGTLQQNLKFVQQFGAFDFIFIDHFKQYYLPDLMMLEKAGGIAKGTIVIGDNIFYPGAPQYLGYFKTTVLDKYKSILYHSFLEYSSVPDAVLVSERLQ